MKSCLGEHQKYRYLVYSDFHPRFSFPLTLGGCWLLRIKSLFNRNASHIDNDFILWYIYCLEYILCSLDWSHECMEIRVSYPLVVQNMRFSQITWDPKQISRDYSILQSIRWTITLTAPASSNLDYLRLERFRITSGYEIRRVRFLRPV